MNIQQYDVTLDVTGMNCPRMETGQTLQLLATDKSAPEDFTAFCRQTGHELVQLLSRDDGILEIVLRHR